MHSTSDKAKISKSRGHQVIQSKWWKKQCIDYDLAHTSFFSPTVVVQQIRSLHILLWTGFKKKSISVVHWCCKWRLPLSTVQCNLRKLVDNHVFLEHQAISIANYFLLSVLNEMASPGIRHISQERMMGWLFQLYKLQPMQDLKRPIICMKKCLKIFLLLRGGISWKNGFHNGRHTGNPYILWCYLNFHVKGLNEEKKKKMLNSFFVSSFFKLHKVARKIGGGWGGIEDIVNLTDEVRYISNQVTAGQAA